MQKSTTACISVGAISFAILHILHTACTFVSTRFSIKGTIMIPVYLIRKFDKSSVRFHFLALRRLLQATSSSHLMRNSQRLCKVPAADKTIPRSMPSPASSTACSLGLFHGIRPRSVNLSLNPSPEKVMRNLNDAV